MIFPSGTSQSRIGQRLPRSLLPPTGPPGPCPLQGGKIHYTGSVIKKIRHLTEYEVRGSFFILHRARLAGES